MNVERHIRNIADISLHMRSISEPRSYFPDAFKNSDAFRFDRVRPIENVDFYKLNLDQNDALLGDAWMYTLPQARRFMFLGVVLSCYHFFFGKFWTIERIMNLDLAEGSGSSGLVSALDGVEKLYLNDWLDFCRECRKYHA